MGSLTCFPGEDFIVPRPLLSAWGIQWWNPVQLISAGNPAIFGETLFGGYRLHIKIKSWVHSWSSSSVRLGDVTEELWAMAPGSTTPISAGSVSLLWEYSPAMRRHTLLYVTNPSQLARCYLPLDPAPDGYWLKGSPPIGTLPSFIP